MNFSNYKFLLLISSWLSFLINRNTINLLRMKSKN